MRHVTLKLGDIKPNPYRDFKEVPLDPKNIEALRDSIRETGFWSGLQVRKSGDDYQLVFGHNRVEAGKQELGPDFEYEFDLIDADEQEMIRRMNFENLQDVVQPTLGHLKIGVRAARDQIEAALRSGASRDAPDWADNANGTFTKAQKDGVIGARMVAIYLYGSDKRRKTIDRVLGQIPLTPWQEQKRQEAVAGAGGTVVPLDALKKAKADLAYNPEAGEFFHRPAHADTFRRAVVSEAGQAVLTKEDQKRLAEKIAKTLKQVPGGTQPPAIGGIATANTPADERLNEANIERMVQDEIAVRKGLNAQTLKLERKAKAYADKAEEFTRWVEDLHKDLLGDLGTLMGKPARDLKITLDYLQKQLAVSGPVIFGLDPQDQNLIGDADIIEGEIING